VFLHLYWMLLLLLILIYVYIICSLSRLPNGNFNLLQFCWINNFIDCFKCRASDTKSVSWNFAELAQYSESQGSGSLKARFKVDSLCPISTIVIQFNSTTLSRLEFELASSGYRVSLIKRCFDAGKFPLLIILSKYDITLFNIIHVY